MHSLLWIQGKKPALNINASTVLRYKLYSCDTQPDCCITAEPTLNSYDDMCAHDVQEYYFLFAHN